MKIHCPESECLPFKTRPVYERIYRRGSYFRRSDGQWIARFQCRFCRRRFSSSSLTLNYRQKRRDLNHRVLKLLASGVSQRRAALLLGVNRKTIVRKFRHLAKVAANDHASWLRAYEVKPLDYIQFDDLETAEHTKCKPLSVAVAVDPKTRKILSFQVSRMPPKGHLVHIARRKYGPRKDERARGWNELFKTLRKVAKADATLLSDENPHYPHRLKKHLPHCRHETVKGGRGSIAGQGELKKLRHDPLFSLNHTCAMMRANMNRLFRRTWCMTKKPEGLIDHLNLYVWYHNHVLT